MRRLWVFCITVISVLWLCTGVSLANSPAPARAIYISPKNVPEEAVFLDLLIPMSQEDPYYSIFNSDMGEEVALIESAPIARYKDGEGYISYSFHMKNAASQMKLLENRFCSFGEGVYAGEKTHLEYIIQNLGTIKVAVLDETGTVLAVSEEVSIKMNRGEYLVGMIGYDCSSGKLEPSIYRGGQSSTALLFIAILAVSMIIRALLTALVESVIAWALKIRPLSTVFTLNIVSNLLFNLLLAFSMMILQMQYLLFVAVGELTVVWAEYTFYRIRLKSYDRRHLLGFVIIANLASLLLGMVLKHGGLL